MFSWSLLHQVAGIVVSQVPSGKLDWNPHSCESTFLPPTMNLIRSARLSTMKNEVHYNKSLLFYLFYTQFVSSWFLTWLLPCHLLLTPVAKPFDKVCKSSSRAVFVTISRRLSFSSCEKETKEKGGTLENCTLLLQRILKMLGKFSASCPVLVKAVLCKTLVTYLWLHWKLNLTATLPASQFPLRNSAPTYISSKVKEDTESHWVGAGGKITFFHQ